MTHTPAMPPIAKDQRGWSVHPGDVVTRVGDHQPFQLVALDHGRVTVERFLPGRNTCIGRVRGRAYRLSLPAAVFGLTPVTAGPVTAGPMPAR